MNIIHHNEIIQKISKRKYFVLLNCDQTWLSLNFHRSYSIYQNIFLQIKAQRVFDPELMGVLFHTVVVIAQGNEGCP